MIRARLEILNDPQSRLFNGHVIEANRFGGYVKFAKPKLIWDEVAEDWAFDLFDCWWQRAKDFADAERMIMEDCGIRRPTPVRL